jgi:hypothetical protein
MRSHKAVVFDFLGICTKQGTKALTLSTHYQHGWGLLVSRSMGLKTTYLPKSPCVLICIEN